MILTTTVLIKKLKDKQYYFKQYHIKVKVC